MRTHKTTKLQQQHKQRRRRRRRRRRKTDRELLWMRERPPIERLRLHCSEFVDDFLLEILRNRWMIFKVDFLELLDDFLS
jgi:hypothetical protein